MAPNKRAGKAARRAQGTGVPTPAAPAILGDWQRRVVLMLLFSGLGSMVADRFRATLRRLRDAL